MIKKEYRGLDSRINLAKELAKQYTNKNASSTVCITGNRGTGKSFVMDNVLKLLENNNKIAKYKNFGENFIQYDSNPISKCVNSLSVSVGNPLLSLGLGIGWETNANTYNRIRNILSKILVSDVLFCVDNFYEADSEIRTITKLIIEHMDILQADFKVSIYFLITDTDINHISFHDSEQITEYELIKYNSADINTFLTQQYKVSIPQESETENIARICNGNLNLVKFLYDEKITYGSSYLDALERVVNKRLAQLKQSGKKKNLDEYELEDVISSASLSIKQFTKRIIAEIINHEEEKIFHELNVAKEEELLTQDREYYYDFISNEIKSQIAVKTIQTRKDWLLTYYMYYTNNEQDEYGYRAYYLIKYQGYITSASFSLLMLAYSAAFEIRDDIKAQKIIEGLEEMPYAEPIYAQLCKNIKKFYCLLSCGSTYTEIEDAYAAIDMDELELPLKAELTRAYFHHLYVNTNMNTTKALILLDKCREYALNELYLDIKCTELESYTDETILRLKIIYDIAPCVLDCLNQYENFQVLYQKSKELSRLSSCSKKGRSMGQYIENVFNRKAFLFVNQTQCDTYYHKAKRYFKENEIWDEYCITLICEAGSDIVIQQYKEAISCCEKVISICQEKNIQLPLMEKLHNNKIIATFLYEEQNVTTLKKRLASARKAIKSLKQLLMSRKCATEYVILTNLCSLNLYWSV